MNLTEHIRSLRKAHREKENPRRGNRGPTADRPPSEQLKLN